MTRQVKVDLLIQVTTWAGLTLYIHSNYDNDILNEQVYYNTEV